MKRKKSPSSFQQVADALLQLRLGEVGMEEVRPLVRQILKQRAMYFWRRWCTRQTLYGWDDLYSMGEIAVWRAVDTWDPQKRPIADYVNCEVGRAMEKPLIAAAGYPDARRGEPALQIYFGDMEVSTSNGWKSRGSYGGQEAMLTMDSLLRAREEIERDQHVQLERHQHAQAVCEGITDEFGRLVVRLVLEGYTIAGAATAMYGSKRLRVYYGLRNVQHAKKAAHAAAVRVRLEVGQLAA